MEETVNHVCPGNILHWRWWEIWKSPISLGLPIWTVELHLYNNSYYHKPSGTGCPAHFSIFLWHWDSLSFGAPLLHWSWWGCNHGVSLPSQLTDTLQEGWSLTIVHFSLVPGIGPRGGGFIKSIRIVTQNFGRGARRVAPSIFLKAKS